jgi:hypothetical protein
LRQRDACFTLTESYIAILAAYNSFVKITAT